MRDVRSSGFTLLELMITVVILAIIVGIAYPAYQNYTTQTRRADAKIALTQLANQLEKFFSSCPQVGYTNAITTGTIANCDGLDQPDNLSPDKHYQLSIAAGPTGDLATSFTITATPVAGGLQVGDGALRLHSTGLKEWDKNNDNGWCCSWSDK